MTYFYKIKGTIARKIGGEPPADEYVAIDPQGVVRHVKNNEILEEQPMRLPEGELQDLYKDAMGKQIARSMLFPAYRKKKNTRPTRKIKVSKRCICK